MFAIPLFRYKIKNFKTKKKKLLALKGDLVRHRIMPDGSVTSLSISTDFWNKNQQVNKKYDDEPNRKKIQEIFSDEFEEWYKESTIRSSIKNYWFEESTIHDYHGVHTHGPIGYSSVVYLDYDPKQHSPTFFLSFYNNFVNREDNIHSPEVEEGDMILFPSIVPHFTTPNTSQIPRQIFSMNLDVFYEK